MDWAGAAALSAALISVNIGVIVAVRIDGRSCGCVSASSGPGCFVIFWFVEKHGANPLISTVI